MKVIFAGIATIAFLSIPLCASAQPVTPVTRAQVKAEIVQLEKAGYNPAAKDNARYPGDIQAAESRVAAQASADGNTGAGYGGSSAGTADAGQPISNATRQSIYGHR